MQIQMGYQVLIQLLTRIGIEAYFPSILLGIVSNDLFNELGF